MPWWYLSFVDAKRPKGQQFLGAALVQGDTQAEAVHEAWANDCNPGGAIRMAGPISSLPDHLDPAYTWRLLSTDDLQAAGLITQEELEQRKRAIWADEEP